MKNLFKILIVLGFLIPNSVFAQATSNFWTFGSGANPYVKPVLNSWGLLVNSSTTLQNFSAKNGSTTALTTTGSTFLSTIGGSTAIASTSGFGKFSIEQGTETASLWIGNQGSSTASFVVEGVNGNGNVGVGTNNPTSQFHVQANDGTGIAYKMTGTASLGVTDNNDGVALVLVYNASGNRQFLLGDTANGNGIRFLGYGLDAYNYISNTRQDLILGTDTTDISVLRNLGVVNRMTTVFASSTIFSNSGIGYFGNLLVTASTTLQNFTGLNATTSNATTTSLAVLNLSAANCDVKASTSGSFYCGTDATGSGGGTFPFDPTTSFATGANSTSTLLLLSGGLSASSTIRFGNNAVSGFTFDSTTGNLGLGTTTRASKLSVLGLWGDPATSLFNIASSTSSNGTTSASVFTVLSNGNVGVGTSSPFAKFSVRGADGNANDGAGIAPLGFAVYGGNGAVEGANGGGMLFVGGDGLSSSDATGGTGGVISIIGGVGASGVGANGPGGSIYLVGGSANGGSAGNVILGVTAEGAIRGKVGISTSTPSKTFAVGGVGGMYNGGNFFNAGTITSTSSSASTLPYASTTAITATGSAFFATLSGSVGIGTTSPTAVLGINSVGGKDALMIGSSTASILTIDSVGHILYGTSSPSLSSCGTTPSLYQGNDNNGIIRVGTGAVTACTLTFGSPYPTIGAIVPVCSVGYATSTASNTFSASTTVSSLRIGSLNTMGNQRIWYKCSGAMK